MGETCSTWVVKVEMGPNDERVLVNTRTESIDREQDEGYSGEESPYSSGGCRKS